MVWTAKHNHTIPDIVEAIIAMIYVIVKHSGYKDIITKVNDYYKTQLK